MTKVQAKFTDVRFVFLPITLFILLNATGYICSNAEINIHLMRSGGTEQIGKPAQSIAALAQYTQSRAVETYAPVDFYHSLLKPVIKADEIRVYGLANSGTGTPGASIARDVLKRDYRSGEPGFKAIKSVFLNKRAAGSRDILNFAAETGIVFLKKNKWLCQTFYNPPDRS